MQSSGTTNDLYGVSFTDAFTGTAVGANGTILRTTTGGVVGVGEDDRGVIPGEFSLSQNYPNPFNPMTTITFSVGTDSYTSLRVYDHRGREVATLVNEVKQPGQHSVTWDARGMATGVYLCSLQSGNLVQTRKLLLLR